MQLSELCAALERIAPLALAESWDNVGLLIDPRGPEASVSRILLTIDLTESVLAEAMQWRADAVVSYHPPLFSPLKRITLARPGERVIVGAIAAGLSVYSPHTALDAAAGGIGDWLAEGLGAGSFAPHAPDEPAGVVRQFVLAEPTSLAILTERIKRHLGLPALRVAASALHREGAPIRRIALCPGAGGAAFESISDVDAFWTGEMRHHDVLARVASGKSVILSEHTHTERGYLPVLARRLSELFGGDVVVRVSESDREPVALV